MVPIESLLVVSYLTHRKSHTGFPVVTKSVTLNDHEWHNGRCFALSHRIRKIWCQSRQSGWSWPKRLRQKYSPKNPVFGNTWLTVTFSESTENESVKERYSHSKATMWLVQHCAAISAIAQLLLQEEHPPKYSLDFRPHWRFGKEATYSKSKTNWWSADDYLMSSPSLVQFDTVR